MKKNIFKDLFKLDNKSLEIELMRLWAVQIYVLLNMIIIHFYTDTTLLGVRGLILILSLNIPIIFLPQKTKENRVVFIYASLIILTLSCLWYIFGNNGLSSPMASFMLAVPGIALYFLGKKHAFIWLGIIIFLYIFITFGGQILVNNTFTFPEVRRDLESIEELMISFLMLFVTCYIFYTIKDIKQKLSNIALHDQLTGILNRNGIRAFVDYEQRKFKRNKKPFSVMILDIDYFKKINDTYGHDVGDIVIAKVGQILKDSLRDSDSTARWGGEEFLILLPETNLEFAIERAEKVRKSIESFRFNAKNMDKNFNITVSIGVSGLDGHEDDLNFDELLSQADKGLYKAKNSGRNQVCG